MERQQIPYLLGGYVMGRYLYTKTTRVKVQAVSIHYLVNVIEIQDVE